MQGSILPHRPAVPFKSIRYALLLLFCLNGALVSCQRTAPVSPDESLPGNGREVLFVGNSLTYTNNLPERVVRIAAAKGIKIVATTLAYPNYALEDHLAGGELQRLISKGNYEFVIVQQGPSSQEDGRQSLQTMGFNLKELCEPRKSKLVFFMVWPAMANWWTFDGVIRNYTDAAAATGSLLCPVGKVWKEYIETTKDYSYYGPDQFHPSATGSEMAAQVIVETLF